MEEIALALIAEFSEHKLERDRRMIGPPHDASKVSYWLSLAMEPVHLTLLTCLRRVRICEKMKRNYPLPMVASWTSRTYAEEVSEAGPLCVLSRRPARRHIVRDEVLSSTGVVGF